MSSLGVTGQFKATLQALYANYEKLTPAAKAFTDIQGHALLLKTKIDSIQGLLDAAPQDRDTMSSRDSWFTLSTQAGKLAEEAKTLLQGGLTDSKLEQAQALIEKAGKLAEKLTNLEWLIRSRNPKDDEGPEGSIGEAGMVLVDPVGEG